MERNDIQRYIFLLGLFIKDFMAYITGWPESDTLADRLARKRLCVEEGWNKNMVAHFDLIWVGVLDESFQEWINHYTWTGCVFVPWKPHTFKNYYRTIACDKSEVIYNVEIV